MTTSREPLDDAVLTALFDEVELPPGLEARWQNKVTAPDGPRTPASHWLRAAAAGVTALAAVGMVGLVAADRPPSDRPDPDVIPTFVRPPPTRSSTQPDSSAPQASASTAPTSGGAQPPVGTGPATSGPQIGQPPPTANPEPPAPARGPLPPNEWPDSGNTGVPATASLRGHTGDLHVTTPGAVIADLRVDGVIYVDAPDVTLRRVLVAAPASSEAAVHQRAPRLTIEDSEISGTGFSVGKGVLQQAAWLTVRRCDLHSVAIGIQLTDNAAIIDNHIQGMVERGLLTTGDSTGLVVRHNTIVGPIALFDDTGPVTEATVENNRLGRGDGVAMWAPPGVGSHHVRVLSNHFARTGANPAPVSGWNARAPGNTWSGNVWSDTNEPVVP